MENLYNCIQESIAYIHSLSKASPKVGIILGTGLSKLGAQITNPHSIPYSAIPHFPVSTVDSHTGNLIIGKIGKVEVIAMQGRFHYYEGYTMREVTYPIRVMKFLGVDELIISNASGGLNEKLSSGDIAVIKDHINYQPENPLRGINDDRLGIRFPDMTDAYTDTMRHKVLDLAKAKNIDVREAVYLGLQGPSLETQAELRFFKLVGADIVGMSTVPEVIVAKQCGMDVLALSVVTNECLPEVPTGEKTTIEEVIRVANQAEPILTELVIDYINEM